MSAKAEVQLPSLDVSVYSAGMYYDQPGEPWSYSGFQDITKYREITRGKPGGRGWLMSD